MPRHFPIAAVWPGGSTLNMNDVTVAPGANGPATWCFTAGMLFRNFAIAVTSSLDTAPGPAASQANRDIAVATLLLIVSFYPPVRATSTCSVPRKKSQINLAVRTRRRAGRFAPCRARPRSIPCECDLSDRAAQRAFNLRCCDRTIPSNGAATSRQRTAQRNVRAAVDFGRPCGMATPWAVPGGVAVSDRASLVSNGTESAPPQSRHRRPTSFRQSYFRMGHLRLSGLTAAFRLLLHASASVRVHRSGESRPGRSSRGPGRGRT